jgi:hypothetical protein
VSSTTSGTASSRVLKNTLRRSRARTCAGLGALKKSRKALS